MEDNLERKLIINDFIDYSIVYLILHKKQNKP
jgi:hypothetical protein